ncbi:MAG: glycine--tRNA ligase subunit beta, partial [Gammaproteobacteria bacterium]
MAHDLLFELGCEELPPKALKNLAIALERGVVEGLEQAGLQHGATKWYATPRRLALWIEGLAARQPDKRIERRGPAVQAAFDASNQPTQAALGFARSCGVGIEQLQRLKTDKGEWLAHTLTESGQPTTELIPDILEIALKRLPIPKRMRWGDRETSFIRPVHWVVLLFGEEIIPCNILGIAAGNTTRGHRFHAPQPIQLNRASKEEYEEKLKESKVIADFAERKRRINDGIVSEAKRAKGLAMSTEWGGSVLTEEITSINEWPTAILCQYDKRFLNLPREVLISELRVHQRCYEVADPDTILEKPRLLPYFITVSNIESKKAECVKTGNERVIRARF